MSARFIAYVGRYNSYLNYCRERGLNPRDSRQIIHVNSPSRAQGLRDFDIVRGLIPYESEMENLEMGEILDILERRPGAKYKG